MNLAGARQRSEPCPHSFGLGVAQLVEYGQGPVASSSSRAPTPGSAVSAAAAAASMSVPGCKPRILNVRAAAAGKRHLGRDVDLLAILGVVALADQDGQELGAAAEVGAGLAGGLHAAVQLGPGIRAP